MNHIGTQAMPRYRLYREHKDDIGDMMSVLFPTMNIDDQEAFLRDLHESQPEKFLEAWPKTALTLDEKEKSQLIEKLGRKKYGI